MLNEVRENCLWQERALGNFEEWVAEFAVLPTSRSSDGGSKFSWACRAADIHKFFVLQLGKPREELLKVGRAKLVRLIPVARKGELTDELWKMALDPTVSDRDLRQRLGHNVEASSATTDGDGEEPYIEVECPRCGNTWLLKGARWM